MAPAGRWRVHPHGGPAAGVLQPPALLRPGPARRVGEVAAGAASPSTFRVASWNIRAAIGPGEPFPPAWWRHVRRDRFERIAREIRALDVAAIGLQEVALLTPGGALNDQPAELARLTGLEVRYAAVHAYQLVEPEDGRAIGVATWGNAILGRVALERGFAIGLPGGADDTLVESPDAHLPLAGVRYRDAEPGAREPRCVVGGAMTLGGVRTWVLTTHFAYAGRDQRRAQAAAVLDCIAGLEGPVVLLGDLNAPSEDPELADLRASLTDAFDAVGVAAGDERRRSTANARIDHVFVRGLRVIDCRVDPGPGDASDHLPVVATLSTV